MVRFIPLFLSLLFSFVSSFARAAGPLTMHFFDDDKRLPASYRPGITYAPDNTQNVTLDGTDRRIGPANYRAGLEWRGIPNFIPRLGYNTDPSKKSFAGIGMGMKAMVFGQQISYMWMPMKGLGTAHFLSITHRFGK